MGDVPVGFMGVQKADKKMVNIWMLRWSFAAFFITLFMIFPIWMTFFWEFDEVTGEIINFSFTTLILSILVMALLTLAISLGITRAWATMYWNRYTFEFHGDRIVISRGVIGKKVTNIQYERIQNVNVWKGILERIFGLSSIMIETAGSTQMQMGAYAAFSLAEGTIQGISDPQPMVDYLMKRAKGCRDGLMSAGMGGPELTKEKKLELLEERLLRGEITEKTYNDLKAKYEN